jgi:hypothetical protein
VGETSDGVESRTLLVSDGRVACPRYGDLDVESCFDCEYLGGPDDDVAFRRIECTVPRARHLDAFDLLRGVRSGGA